MIKLKKEKQKKVIVIGSGFAGLASACYLAKDGYDVTILEKNAIPGGRCRKFEAEGFTFDMGPSWYWMPEVFDQFFEHFGKKVSDYYELVRLDPSYTIHFGKDDEMEVPAHLDDLKKMFEQYEPGSGKNLDLFLKEAAYKYKVGMNEFVHKPGLSIMEFADIRVFKSVFRLQMLSSMSDHVKKLFKNEKLRKLLEFPVLFLGATPEKTPAMYSLMNHADLALGTWYPLGGMHEIIKGMVSLAEELGVKIQLNTEVNRLYVPNRYVKKVMTNKGEMQADIIIGAADYNHVEQHLLDEGKRDYTPKYWDNRTMAPSSLLFYLGIDKKIEGLHHHNLFFDTDFKKHAHEIYEDPKWPEDPLFYVCSPSITDHTVAPKGCENIFVLIPLAPDLEDTEKMREKYYHMVMDRLEHMIGTSVKEHVIYKRSYAHKDFKSDYNAFKGNAYGLANTLKQTAILKPRLKSKKVKNLFYTGQLTTPGPGVPPSLISGKVVADQINKDFPINN
jgi:phytoene desaturase